MTMPSMDESDVVARSVCIRRMLRPLTSLAYDPTVRPYQTGGVIVLGASQGVGKGRDYRRWRFLTRVARVRASYHELWQETRTRSQYRLAQMYLALYEVDRLHDREQELLALHSDPSLEEDLSEDRYKRGPHLHVVSVPAGFHRAHLSLELSSLQSILSSCTALTESMTQLVQMISDEVLHRIDT